MTPRVAVLRGTAGNPFELRPWELLHRDGRAEVQLVVGPDNQYDVSGLDLPVVRVPTVGARMPPGPPGRLALKAVGQRHLGLARALKGAEVVHAAELGYWFSAQAARQKRRASFKLALTVWETLPFGDAYRNVRTRRYRRDVLEATDLFLPVTERARAALLLEGVPSERTRVCPPGIDSSRFAADGVAPPPGGHTLLSVGRLVWEKGHQDLLRALALLRGDGHDDVHAEIVGVGPEEGRLRGVIADLGLGDAVSLRGAIPHDALPRAYADASCLVLASLPTAYWEEQFGMVLAEAMAARLPVIAAASGAIPEVLAGNGILFEPGDWRGLATALAEGPLSREPATRSQPAPELVSLYSAESAADRLDAAYRELLLG